jgi:hypothetical protein
MATDAAIEKPPMDPDVRPFIEEARARHLRRPPNPGVVVENAGPQRWRFGSPHRELDPWQIQIVDAFGTRSALAAQVFLDQLATLCMGEPSYGPNGWQPDELQLNFALNLVSGMRPRNEAEAALAAQMVAVHFMTMQLSARALRNPYGDPRTAALAGKLARTYAMQAETMAKLKGKAGKQRITVRYERHNHHHEHQHLHAEGAGGTSDFGGQPQGPTGRARGRRGADGVQAIEHAERPSVPCQDAARDALPVSGDTGAGAMSDTRGRERIGRA